MNSVDEQEPITKTVNGAAAASVAPKPERNAKSKDVRGEEPAHVTPANGKARKKSTPVKKTRKAEKGAKPAKAAKTSKAAKEEKTGGREHSKVRTGNIADT